MRRVREPVELHMHDPMACASCVTANLLYMFGFIDTPFKLREIDKLIGRKAGRPSDGGRVPALLKKGLHLTSVSGLDVERALGPDGYKYMRSYYTKLNDYDTLHALTADRYKDWRAGTQDLITQKHRLPGKSSQIVEPPMRETLISPSPTELLKMAM